MKKITIIGVILATFLVLVAYVPVMAEPSETVNAEIQTDSRQVCLEECKSRYGFGWPNTFGLQYRGGGYGDWEAIKRMYFRCVQKCEKQYWEEFDEEMDDLENEL